ncbi:hypothetical protein Poli38472_001014 [Pythium oligandrum]|uniref:Uncharacterized protein n=1 Tax=Pythium oligandrum TaxID=41045 RepID=A0A8K1CV72_PYTOL|nr:hypothetical protein Poli38472_001014 [Pythium oligandrum]|eukprot:TMW68858.1 hypothetical protein Poli38472_001014 [Pythium oligandrum]
MAPTPFKPLTEATSTMDEQQKLYLNLTADLVEREPLPEEIATDEEMRCKYSSKRCVRKRAFKHKGQLHMLCTFHRAKAIVNQRRLELRKRARQESLAGGNTGASFMMLPTITVSDEGNKNNGDGVSKPSPRDILALEPFLTPATLFPEDIEALSGLIDMDITDIESFELDEMVQL